MDKDASELIEELVALEQHVKPGRLEWACDYVIGNTRHWNVHLVSQPDRTVCLGLVSMATEEWTLGRYPTAEMKLLVAAHNAVPTLIAEIRRLRAELKENRKCATA